MSLYLRSHMNIYSNTKPFIYSINCKQNYVAAHTLCYSFGCIRYLCINCKYASLPVTQLHQSLWTLTIMYAKWCRHTRSVIESKGNIYRQHLTHIVTMNVRLYNIIHEHFTRWLNICHNVFSVSELFWENNFFCIKTYLFGNIDV